MSKVLAVVGGQYGSEGKGVIVAKIAKDYDVHVRVGGPNAGHSFFHKGRKWAMQAIPCGWINPNAHLFIASGGLIDFETLQREFKLIYAIDPTLVDRLRISPKAGIIGVEHHLVEGGTQGRLHKVIGSTGEGVGAARMARIGRESFRFAKDLLDYELADGVLMRHLVIQPPAEMWLPAQIDKGRSVLLEGTQGYGLSLIHGEWPYVTSADTTAGQLCADCGVSPRDLTDVLMVVRTHPIRVAGNSGELAEEMTWDEVSAIVGKKVEERTTVTKKIRRIGHWNEGLFKCALAVNRPTSLACTFLDYLDPGIEGRTDEESIAEFPKARSFIEYLEVVSKVHVQFCGTGGPEWSVIER